jgi:long-chain acyl-CoA synthetase
MIAVPRIFEKIYNGIRNQVDMDPIKKRLFDWAVGLGKAAGSYKMQHKMVPLTLALKYQVAHRLVFKQILEKLGGNLRFAFSGGAPLSKEIGEFFHAAGVLLLEGYGLTETTAAVTANSPYDYRFGTVGKPFGDVELKLAADGEILVKSLKVFREYYKDPKATAEVLKDGWFSTGDIGEFTSEGFLRITDRKKDLIKTSGGKYVAPQRLEALLKHNKHISNVLIHGDQRKYIVALITLDPNLLQDYAKAKDLANSDPDHLVETAEVKELVRMAVAEANSQLASYESIKNFAILPRDFSVEDGELTPSLKVKRKYCDQKYRDVLDNLYGVDHSAM